MRAGIESRIEKGTDMRIVRDEERAQLFLVASDATEAETLAQVAATLRTGEEMVYGDLSKLSCWSDQARVLD